MNTRERGEDAIKYVEVVYSNPGVTTRDLAAKFGVLSTTVTFALRLPQWAPMVRMDRPSFNKPARWFPAHTKMTNPRAITIKPRHNVKVEPPPVGEVIVAENVKVTVCPSGKDQRFTFTAPPGWVGQITRDWRERRLGECR